MPANLDDAAYETALYWIREREAIRLRRERGESSPWTDDSILRKWRFCNVRREDDRVTRWIALNIRGPYASHPDLWLMLCAARLINWPPSLAELLQTRGAWFSHCNFTPENLGFTLEDRAQRDEKVFTGAYVVSAPAETGSKKTYYVAEVVLGGLWRDRRALISRFSGIGASLRNAHDALLRYPGWGFFLAYQAVIDARFCPRLLASAPDVTTWAAAGPGTIRGLNRLHGRAVTAGVSQERALNEIRRLYETLPVDAGVAMDLSDVPNVLCEVDKYLRVRNGEGVPRARYVPETEF